MSQLIVPGRDPAARDRIARRMEGVYSEAARTGAVDTDTSAHPNLERDPWQPRWRIDARYIEFECGCRARRCFQLGALPVDGDPIIFGGMQEQAVYDFVCDRHAPGMNVYVGFARFATFDQWRRERFHLLTGAAA